MAAVEKGPVILYSTVRFPKISETFVLDEMLNLERLGARLELVPLIHQVEDATHPEAIHYEQRAHYGTAWSRKVLAANLRRLMRQPGRYLSTLGVLTAGMARSRDFLPKSLLVFLQAVWFAEIAESAGAEHQHAQWATHSTTALWVVWRLTGIPFSFTTHGADSLVDSTFLDRKLRDAKFATPTNEHLRSRLEEIEPSSGPKLHVIRTGIDISRFDPAHRRPRERFTIVNVARLNAMKGHVHLLDALRELLDRGYDIDLRLVGGGEMHDEILAMIAARDLGDHVVVTGNVAREQVVEEIHAAHMAALSSVVLPNGETEGLPIALIESMAAGVPSVATRVAGVPELIEDGESGFVLPPGDVSALVDTIARIHDDPELATRLSGGGRRRALEEFDERATSKRLFSLVTGPPAP